MMRAKYILSFLSLLCIYNVSYGQLVYTVSALVGDTIYATKRYYDDDSFCGKVTGNIYTVASNEGFTFKDVSSASPVSSTIYFTPMKSGNFDKLFYVSLHYTNNQRGCPPYFQPEFRVIGTAYPDTSSLFLPNAYTLDVYPDTVKRRYEGTLNLVYRNKNPDDISIKDIKYKGDDSDKVVLSYANGTPVNSKRDIAAFSKNDTIRILYSTTDGPYIYDTVKNSFLIATKERNGVKSYDTLFLDVHFHSLSLWNVVTIHPDWNSYLGFECALGDTTYDTATITYTDIVKKFRYEPINDNSGFSLYNVLREPNKESVIFRFIPQSVEDPTLEYYFSYFIERFDGSLLEILPDAPADGILLVGHVIPKTYVNKNPIKEKLFIYPNPATDVLWIETDNAADDISINIYDLLGNCVLTDSKQHSNATKSPISIRSLNDGIYYVRILRSNTINTTKLIIDRQIER